MTVHTIDVELLIDDQVYSESFVGDTDDAWFAIAMGEAVARAILGHSRVIAERGDDEDEE